MGTNTKYRKAVVVGLYGIPGCGKTYLLNQLEQNLGQQDFAYYDGSKVIGSVVPGGLEAFQGMEDKDKANWRERAIKKIGDNSANSGKVAIVTGHFIFWSEGEAAGTKVCTEADLKIYTHILYLEIPAKVVERRRRDDTSGRKRPSIPADRLFAWQQQEMAQLRDLCRYHDILFVVVTPLPTLLDRAPLIRTDLDPDNDLLLNPVLTLLKDFAAQSRLDDAVLPSKDQLKIMLAMDADKTLAAEDTGMLFFERVFNKRALESDEFALKKLFNGPMGYSYTAFRQAVLIYEEVANEKEFDELCEHVASLVTMHSEFASLLQLVAKQKHIGAVVITTGLRRVWEKVLEKEGLSEKVKVIGGGRIADGFVVSAAVKAALVTRMKEVYHTTVWAFGDSPLDLDMLCKADHAIVVVGNEQTRSKTMDAALESAIDKDALRARQVLLPSNASPRLDVTKLPTIKLTEPGVLKSLLNLPYTPDGLEVLCATDKSATKLLATRMRDAAVAGPDLREAHRRVGWYLANEFLGDVVGLEKCPIQHVLGHPSQGYQLLHEKQTTIVALMRGGEPMAYGVNDAFPLAMFVHAKDTNDLKPHHLEGQLTVILVDSVINTGKTVIEFVEHVRSLHATIRIVIVAGVVQDQCLSEKGLKQQLAHHVKLHLVALRLSETKFKGSGTTDTGNRLFNTTHLK
ncbi:uracil phosphoribosyltransferase-domain-containing protein [Usnea florida]